MLNRIKFVISLIVLAAAGHSVFAHPIIENAMEVVIDRKAIRIEMRISMEEVLLVEFDPLAPKDYWPQMVEAHGEYLLKKLRVSADGKALGGKVTLSAAPEGSGMQGAGLKMATYRLEYPLEKPPKEVKLIQDFLREYDAWAASFVVKIRQSADASFQTGLLTREKTFVYDCDWSTPAATQPIAATGTNIKFGPTFKEYTVHGIGHIIGPIGAKGWNWREAGFDHLLFATALVLATRKLWDLVKVVTAFTLAHTITLTLSVLNWVALSERIVEPMIAASIVFVAMQNVFWPRRSRGWLRLVVAFGFGLFHGLGFAGGLKVAMSGMPGVGLAAALIGFSLGVEIGHQAVVLPLFGAMAVGRASLGKTVERGEVPDDRSPGKVLDYAQLDPPGRDIFGLITRGASALVGVCGAWYFIVALR